MPESQFNISAVATFSKVDRASMGDGHMLHAFVESMDDVAVVLLDGQGSITYCNHQAGAAFGYGPGELLSQPVDILYTPEDCAQDVPRKDREQTYVEGRTSHTRWHVRRDRTRFAADCTMITLRGSGPPETGFALSLRLPSSTSMVDDTRSRLAAMIDNSADAIYNVSLDGTILSWNRSAELLFGYTTEESVGEQIFRLVPADREEEPLTFLATISHGGAISGLETVRRRKDGSLVDVSVTMSPIVIDGVIVGGFVILRDISERKRAEAVLRDNRNLLALTADVGTSLATRDSLRSMLQGCAEAIVTHLDAAFARVWTLNIEHDVLELQASAGLYTHIDGAHGRVPVGSFKIGKIAKERMPHLTNEVIGDPRVPEQEWARREGMVAFAGYPLVVSDKLVGVVAMFARKPQSDLTMTGLESIADEIAIGIERKTAEENTRLAHDRVSEILESMTDAFYSLDEDFNFTYVNRRAEQWWNASAGMLIGKNIWEAYPFAVGTESYNMIVQAMADKEPLIYETFSALHQNWLEVRLEPRANGLSVYFRDVSERKLRQLEQQQYFAEAQARAERQALINRISLAIRSSLDAEGIEEKTIQLLGEALGVDRCYFATYDFHKDAITVLRDWRRADLPSMQGRLMLKNVKALFDNYYEAGSTRIVNDLAASSLSNAVKDANATYRIRARLSVALLREDNSLVSTLTVAMADGPREWTSDDVELVETVAALTRSAIESARMQQREHNIATQLQQALQPPIPERVPGLILRNYYEAALEEAGVGGDFYDVFPINESCTALVVGDLSGKGLAAATQVATVRLMLRATLYTNDSIADSISTLNHLLAKNKLLTGFATLFVGLYDANDRTLNYVNCGQDPAIVRRSGSLETVRLLPTGMILGAFDESHYTEETITLWPNDAIVVYTDGLTEAGPDRICQLGVEGIEALMLRDTDSGSADPDGMAESLASRLAAGVGAYEAQGVRDDVCLLVAVVE